ncbi:MAG: hypothetical protein K6C98_03300, partial [Treponema sp.]|nr:hypothetical protein [Treponema sp.]
MKRKSIIALIMLCSAFAFAEGIDFSGNVETLWGAGAPWTDSDTAAGRMTLGNTSFTGKLDSYYGNSSALAEGTVTYDSVNSSMDFLLSELWLDYTTNIWGLRIGRQKTAWGKADGIDITNVICPKDLSNLAAMLKTDNKLAVDAVRFSLSGNQFSAEAYWIPFFTPAKLSSGQFEKPDTALWNGEYGLKLSGYFPVLDLSFYGFYGWDDMPFINYKMTATGLNVKGEYKRMSMLGLDAAVPLGETVLRMETAFFPERNFDITAQNQLKGKDSTVLRNELEALCGIDWMPETWTLTAQYYTEFIFGDLSTSDSKNFNHFAT